MTAPLHDPNLLPHDLPIPVDDGAAAHLTGMAVPAISLPTTSDRSVRLDRLPGRTVVYAYPRTGRPGQSLPEGWDMIPGARGCTPQSCGFRDHHGELIAAGASAVFGLSTQDSDYQREASERLHLPFELLSDAGLRFANALRLPTFEVDGMELIKRLTMILQDGHIEHVFYPVFPPDRSAADVVNWLNGVG
jgi:peroxiredoxin